MVLVNAIRQMHAYASSPSNLAIAIAATVLDEASRFEVEFARVMRQHGDDFQYLRTINPAAPLLSQLSRSIFRCAVESAKGSHNLTAAFQMSQHPTTVAKDVLKRWVGKSYLFIVEFNDTFNTKRLYKCQQTFSQVCIICSNQ